MVKTQKINFTLNVTEKCNFNCEYCIEKTQNYKNRYDDFDIEDTLKTLERVIFENNGKKILLSFFGGEPTLKKDKIMSFLNILKEQPFFNEIDLEITTNAFIFFPELLYFCYDNNKILRLTLSYDSAGQYKRNKLKSTRDKVEENVSKYSKLSKELCFNEYLTNVNCCVTEDNADTIFKSYLDIAIDKGIKTIGFNTVFTEYWQNESFIKLYKEYKKIYDFVIKHNINNNRIVYTIPQLGGNHKEFWKKYNSLFYGEESDKTSIKEINYSVINYYETIERRYNNKIHYTIKPLNIDKNIEKIKDIELLTLRAFSCNLFYFDKLTMQLLLGDNIKKYKYDIYMLFKFNKFICNKYKKAIKRTISDNEISFYEYFKNYNFFFLLNKKDIEKIKNINSIQYHITKDNLYINEYVIPIVKINQNIDSYYKDRKLYINNDFIESNNKNYIKSMLKEICRFLLIENNIEINNEITNLIISNFYKFVYDSRR